MRAHPHSTGPAYPIGRSLAALQQRRCIPCSSIGGRRRCNPDRICFFSFGGLNEWLLAMLLSYSAAHAIGRSGGSADDCSGQDAISVFNWSTVCSAFSWQGWLVSGGPSLLSTLGCPPNRFSTEKSTLKRLTLLLQETFHPPPFGSPTRATKPLYLSPQVLLGTKSSF